MHQTSLFLPDGRLPDFSVAAMKAIEASPPEFRPLAGRLIPGTQPRKPPPPDPAKGKLILSVTELLKTKWDLLPYSLRLPGLNCFIDNDLTAEIGGWELLMEGKSNKDWDKGRDGKEGKNGQSLYLRRRQASSNGACMVWNFAGDPKTNTVRWWREVVNGEWGPWRRMSTEELLAMVEDWGRNAYAYPRWTIQGAVTVQLEDPVRTLLSRQAHDNCRDPGQEAALIIGRAFGLGGK